VTSNKRIAGIIDFGDAGPGDPAIDFAGLPDSLAQAVLIRYTDDERERTNLWVRRHFYQLTVPLHAIAAGVEYEREDLILEGLAGIRELLNG
jgi:aminoglycoside 2''-phosphotransferase